MYSEGGKLWIMFSVLTTNVGDQQPPTRQKNEFWMLESTDSGETFTPPYQLRAVTPEQGEVALQIQPNSAGGAAAFSDGRPYLALMSNSDERTAWPEHDDAVYGIPIFDPAPTTEAVDISYHPAEPSQSPIVERREQTDAGVFTGIENAFQAVVSALDELF